LSSDLGANVMLRCRRTKASLEAADA